MKNYLSNLIARELNQVEVLQPRLASRFEPQSSALQEQTPGPLTFEGALAPEDNFGEDTAIIANVMERRVEGLPFERSRSVESASDLSGLSLVTHDEASTGPSKLQNVQPPVSVVRSHNDGEPTQSEGTIPTIAAIEQRDESTASATGSAYPISRAEVLSAETPPPPPAVAKRGLTINTDQLSKAEDMDPPPPRESEPTRITDQRSPRPVLTKLNQNLTPTPSIDLQPVATIINTKTRKRSTTLRSESAPPVSGVSPSKNNRSSVGPKSQPVDVPPEIEGFPLGSSPALVIHAPEAVKLPAAESAEREGQVSPNRPDRFSDEIRQPRQVQRATSLETSVVSWAPDDPMRGGTFSLAETKPLDSGPTINVTIGRIEVRATTQNSEARVQKQRQEQQVLSLDEYLSQRAKGGR